MFFTTKQHQYEFAERTVKRYSRTKAKTEFYSQLFIVSTVEAETMSNSVREFSELHEFFLGKFSLAATVLEGAKLFSSRGAKIFWVFYFSPSKTKKRSSRKFGLQCCSYFRDTPAKIGMFDVCRQFFATHVG